MSDTEVRATPERALWTRRLRWLVLACVALVIVLVGSLAVWARMQSLDEDYGPIGSGSFGGPGVSAGIHYDDDANGYSRARLTTTGNHTAYVFSSMGNDGAHSVVVTGIDHDDVTVGAQWARIPYDGGTPAFAPNTRWHDFPVTLPAGGQVQLRYAIRRPPVCQDKPMQRGGGAFYTDTHDVHWDSLLDAHTSTIGHSDAFGSGDVQVC